MTNTQTCSSQYSVPQGGVTVYSLFMTLVTDELVNSAAVCARVLHFPAAIADNPSLLCTLSTTLRHDICINSPHG